MPRSTEKSQSSKTRTTETKERPAAQSQSANNVTTKTQGRDSATVPIEPARKPSPRLAWTRTSSTTTHDKWYKAFLGEPPRKPRTSEKETKKSTTGSEQSNKKAAPAKSQPKKVRSSVDVIRIPHDSTNFCIKTVPLTEIGRDGLSFGNCVAGENWLLQIPDMRSLHDESTFNWYHRHLIVVPGHEIGGSANYFMYACFNQAAGLPHNKYLGRFTERDVYGDCFLFKTFENLDQDKRPVFIDIGDYTMIDLENGGITETNVRRLLAFMLGNEKVEGSMESSS